MSTAGGSPRSSSGHEEQGSEPAPLSATHCIITISIRDTDDDQIAVSETRELDAGEDDDTITLAATLADAVFNVTDHSAEVDEPA